MSDTARKWQLVVDTHNPDEPELSYEAGFMITAQSRSFLMLMSDKSPRSPWAYNQTEFKLPLTRELPV